MKRHVLKCLAGLCLCTGVRADVVVLDEFDSLDPAWSVSFDEALDWVYTTGEQGLCVTDIVPPPPCPECNGPWAKVTLSRPIKALADFRAEVDFSWNDAGASQAMDLLLLRLKNSMGENQAQGYYDDSWISWTGAYLGCDANECTGTGFNSLPHAGTATMAVERVGGIVTVSFNGNVLHTGPSPDDVEVIELGFWYYPYTTSFFGTICVSRFQVEDLGGVACPADFTGDGIVDVADLLNLLGAWGTPDGDLNDDGTTDVADLLNLLGAWGACA